MKRAHLIVPFISVLLGPLLPRWMMRKRVFLTIFIIQHKWLQSEELICVTSRQSLLSTLAIVTPWILLTEEGGFLPLSLEKIFKVSSIFVKTTLE